MVPNVKIALGPGYQVPMAAKVRAETGIVTRAVGLIVEPAQAEAIVTSGQADFVALARAFLDDPRWVWHAAERLGAPITYPPQYARIPQRNGPARPWYGRERNLGPRSDPPNAFPSVARIADASTGGYAPNTEPAPTKKARRCRQRPLASAHPPVPRSVAGRVIFDTTLPPRGRIAREIERGQVMRVVDLEGRQVGDLIAFNRANLAEKFWISNTVRLNGTVFVTTGHVLYSELSNPMFTILADSCGRHDLLAGSCNAEIDKVRYGVDAHYGCVENFLAALAPYGIERKDIPMSVNFFMNCPVDASGAWTIATPVSEAGDYVDLRAEMDCVVALSNCPQDLNPCNDGQPKPLQLIIYQP